MGYSAWILICYFFQACLTVNGLSDITDDQFAQGCGQYAADIVFVLDASSSIWAPHFTRQLQFVKDFASVFDISHNQTHVGVMTFADTPTEQIFLGQYHTVGEMNSAVDDIEQQLGNTKTYFALQYLREDMFPVHRRPWVPQIAIIITDGASDIAELTVEQAGLTKQDGITIFAIGVGHEEINEAELHAMASEPQDSHVFMVEDYESLDTIRNELGYVACLVDTTPAPTPPQMIDNCNGIYPVDVIFALPDQAGLEDTRTALEFINTVVDRVEISHHQIQAGLAPRNCFEIQGIRLRDHEDTFSFQQDVLRRDLSSLGTYVDMQLSYLQEVGFAEENGGRADAVKMAIMVIDNHSVDSQATLAMAENARNSGIDVIVIGVGSALDRTEVEGIATSGQAYYVRDYEHLSLMTDTIIHLICQGASTAVTERPCGNSVQGDQP